LGCHHHPLPQQPELHSLRYYAFAGIKKMFPLPWRALRKVGLAYKHTKKCAAGPDPAALKKKEITHYVVAGVGDISEAPPPQKKAESAFCVFFWVFFCV
jgi:hypothetical protein